MCLTCQSLKLFIEISKNARVLGNLGHLHLLTIMCLVGGYDVVYKAPKIIVGTSNISMDVHGCQYIVRGT